MSYLYEMFSKMATDKTFVAEFEKYQRENSCCGIYGPDDWLMLQLRSTANAGGGGGGFQSLDYGFRSNPSTGHCHLIPPTIPMGCGKKILEEVHVILRTIAGLMILESVIGTCAGIFAWICFFYWLEKEVIVIPEDEISNLIVIEPESSTSTVVDPVGSNGGYLPPGGPHSGLYNAPPPQGSYYTPSRMPEQPYYSTGFNPRASGSRNPNHRGSAPAAQKSPSRFKEYSKVRQSHGSGQLGTPNHEAPPPGAKTTFKFKSASKKSKANDNSPINLPGPVSHATNLAHISKSTEQREHMLSVAGPYDANSRIIPASGQFPHQSVYLHPYSALPVSVVGSGRYRTMANLNPNPIPIPAPHKTHSKNHQLHKQEVALGGKILGEMHVDHAKDPDPMNPKADGAKGEKGHQDHHATVALVKNKKPPKPKSILPKQGTKAHHGQTGHLAEDIAEMSGNKAKKLIDDVILPVEHNPPPTMGRGGYLANHKKHNAPYLQQPPGELQGKGIPEGVAHLVNGKEISAPSIDGSQAQNIVETIIAPVAVNKTTKDAPNLQAHYADGTVPPHHNDGHGHYLPMGAPGQHNQSRYLPGTGMHQNAHYIGGSLNHKGMHENAHYIGGSQGMHENAHYIGGSQGMHENAHYIGGSQGMHENAHYIGGSQGMHENAHYIGGTVNHNTGMHENAHYIGGSIGRHTPGAHNNAHYLNGETTQNKGSHERAHYLNGGTHARGSHENAHYLGGNRGSHEHAHYLNGTDHRNRGSHENAHYLNGEAKHNRGSHENAHYLNGEARHNRGSHENAHYLNGEAHRNRGSHEHAHYLDGRKSHPPTGEHNHTKYLHDSQMHHENRGDTEAHILYKNPIPIDDTD